jgi:hypothetical protein
MPRLRKYDNRPPGKFKTWHDFFNAYYAGLAKHLDKPRGSRGMYLAKFSREYNVPSWAASKMMRPYRIAFYQDGPHKEQAQKYFAQFENNEFGADILRDKITELVDTNSSRSHVNAEAQRSAMNQVIEYLERISLILDKIDKDFPEEITDQEVNAWAQKIWENRQKLSGFFNRRIRNSRPKALNRMEGMRP